MKRGVVLLGLACCALAGGQEVNLIGSASGVFNNGDNSILGLSYLGSSFNVTTSGGFYALGNNASDNNFNNLGSFTLTGAAANYTGDTFTLDITFSNPTGIQGSNSATYTAQLIGQVAKSSQGGVQIQFPTTTDTFNFSNSNVAGQFTLNVNSVSITPGGTDPITGYGNGHQQAVPEPASLACLLTGFAMISLKRRGKKA